MKDVIMATLEDPHIALEFTKAEKPTLNMWSQLTSVLTYLQVPYNLTQLFWRQQIRDGKRCVGCVKEVGQSQSEDPVNL